MAPDELFIKCSLSLQYVHNLSCVDTFLYILNARNVFRERGRHLDEWTLRSHEMSAG